MIIMIFLVPGGARGWTQWNPTHRIARVLHKGVASGLAAQCTGLVKEVIETREFPKFGEDLDEGVSGARRDRLASLCWLGCSLRGAERE